MRIGILLVAILAVCSNVYANASTLRITPELARDLGIEVAIAKRADGFCNVTVSFPPATESYSQISQVSFQLQDLEGVGREHFDVPVNLTRTDEMMSAEFCVGDEIIAFTRLRLSGLAGSAAIVCVLDLADFFKDTGSSHAARAAAAAVHDAMTLARRYVSESDGGVPAGDTFHVGSQGLRIGYAIDDFCEKGDEIFCVLQMTPHHPGEVKQLFLVNQTGKNVREVK